MLLPLRYIDRCVVRGNWFCMPKQNCVWQKREKHSRWNANTFSGLYNVQYIEIRTNIHTYTSTQSVWVCVYCASLHCTNWAPFQMNMMRAHAKGECQRESKRDTWKVSAHLHSVWFVVLPLNYLFFFCRSDIRFRICWMLFAHATELNIFDIQPPNGKCVWAIENLYCWNVRVSRATG